MIPLSFFLLENSNRVRLLKISDAEPNNLIGFTCQTQWTLLVYLTDNDIELSREAWISLSRLGGMITGYVAVNYPLSVFALGVSPLCGNKWMGLDR